jgi:hypothetical protein
MASRSSIAWSMALLVSVGCGSSGGGGPADPGSSDAGQSGRGGSGGARAQGGRGAADGGAGSGGSSTSGSGTSGSGAGGAGGGGKAGSGGRGGQGGGPAAGSGGGASEPNVNEDPAADNSASVLQRNKHASRDGHFVQPTLTRANVMKFARDTGFNATFEGDMWASPLYLEDGPNDQGAFFAVTTGNDVFALDETTGSTLWSANLGASPTETDCGNIRPLGVISTPVIDEASRSIFVAGAIGSGEIARHELHALSVDDGSARAGWPVNMADISAGGVSFAPRYQNQRSALSILNNTVYVAYGGHFGDCGSYRGWVVAVDANDSSRRGAWVSRGAGEAIWAAGGMASDGTNLFAVTGNNMNQPRVTTRDNTDSEEVVRLTGLAQHERNDQNLYYPSHWQMMDSADADFGASNPIYVRIHGAKPEHYVIALAKDGYLYLLDRDNLGGNDGHIAEVNVSRGNMSVRAVPTAYTTNQGTYVVFSTLYGGQCPDGESSGARIVAVRITAGSPPTAAVAWCAGYGGGETSPIVTTTDGKTDPTVWIMDGSSLRALDGDTGSNLFSSDGGCSDVRKWTSPIAVKGRIVAGADNQLCSWSAH